MKSEDSLLKSIIEVSHIEFQSYSFDRRELICTSGLAQKVLGYSDAEFRELSRNFYEGLVHPEDLSILKRHIDDLVKSSAGEVVEMTARLRKSDGNYIWVYTRKMVTERNEKGTPRVYVSIAENVSNLVLLKNELKEKVQQLQSISWKNSHLLRGPVASIIGLIDLIEEKDITSPQNRQVFNFMKQAIKKLDSVVHEINEGTNK